jgi:hypothetical protein
MKKNKSLFIILVLLSALAFFFVVSKNNSTLKKELSDFAVKDTASITKIFLADRNGHTIKLERKESKWLLNGKYEPRPDFLNLFLETVYKVEVKARVAKAAYNNVVKALAATGIKCEIYLKDENDPYKVYYVGGQTENSEGTFMILENSSTPFITEINSFLGYLTPRYSVDEDAWRSTLLFNSPPKEIKTLTLNYTNFPEKSFTIRSINNTYTIENQSTNKEIKADIVSIENYLRLYENVYFESWVRKMSPLQVDSIIKRKPAITIGLTTQKGLTKEVSIYPMPINERSLTKEDSLGNPLKYDLDRMYGFIKPEKELVTIQHYTFDKLLRQLSDFEQRNPKEAIKP